MEETTPQSSPQPAAKLSKEARSKIMSEAASRRWAKEKRAKGKTAKSAKSKVPQKKKVSSPREFSSALRTAEKRLAIAITEKAKAAATYAVLSAEIPSLQRLIIALKNPLGVLPEYPGSMGLMQGIPVAPTLEQIVGDQPLGYQNPPRNVPAQVPVPQQLHPANTQGRAAGGAVGVDLQEEEDENAFLTDQTPTGGGSWH